MIAELRAKGQITIPQKLIKQLNLEVGDKFEIIEFNGELRLIPVVVYPRNYMDQLELEAKEAWKQYEEGKLKTYDNVDNLFADLDEGNDL